MNINDDYQEIEPTSDPDKRKEYWEIGKGLQQVDGLDTSEYLETVRSNCSNIQNVIYPDSGYLYLFFENILMDANHDLDNQDLRCPELF